VLFANDTEEKSSPSSPRHASLPVSNEQYGSPYQTPENPPPTLSAPIPIQEPAVSEPQGTPELRDKDTCKLFFCQNSNSVRRRVRTPIGSPPTSPDKPKPVAAGNNLIMWKSNHRKSP